MVPYGKIIQVRAQWAMTKAAQVKGDNINKPRYKEIKDKRRKKQTIITNLFIVEVNLLKPSGFFTYHPF